MNKKIILPLIIVGSLGMAGVGITAANAAATSTSTYPPIVQKIADHFGLKVADVQAVFDQEKSDMQAKRQSDLKTKLDQAVANGKLTSTQETSLLDLLNKFEQQENNFRTMTPEERKTAVDTARQELQTWATQNNINLQGLGVGYGQLMGRHMGAGRGHMGLNSNTTQSN